MGILEPLSGISGEFLDYRFTYVGPLSTYRNHRIGELQIDLPEALRRSMKGGLGE